MRFLTSNQRAVLKYFDDGERDAVQFVSPGRLERTKKSLVRRRLLVKGESGLFELTPTGNSLVRTFRK